MTPRQPLFDRLLPEDWQLLAVDEVKAPGKHSCVAGPFGSNISSKYFVDSGVPVIRGNNLRDDLTRFVPKGFAFVSEEQARKYKPQHVRPNDLVFTCWGTLGQIGLIPEDGPYPEYIISNKQLKLSPNREICDPLYLFYYLGSPEMIHYIRRIASSAAVPGINLALLKSFQIALPPLDAQERIASILSAYDDLIENNTRRIAILEEMARALYQEWFVHFRFPGHEHVPLVDSPLGPIPEGWEIKRLSDFADTQYGYTTSATSEVNGPKFLRGMDINKRTYIDWSTVPYCKTLPDDVARFKLRKGDVLVVRMADPGKVGIVEEEVEAVFASYLVRLRFDQTALPPGFVFQMLSSERYQGYVTGASSGTTRKSIPAPAMTAFDFALPAPDVLQRCEEIAGPVRALLGRLVRQNANLRATRNLLLPKLISGEIDVSALPEEPIAEAAD